MWQILLAHPNYETGGARQSAVAAQPMHVWRVCQLKSGFKYPDHSNNCTFSPVRAKLKTWEASKVKFACFKGIVHPTDIHGSWGTWLGPDLHHITAATGWNQFCEGGLLPPISAPISTPPTASHNIQLDPPISHISTTPTVILTSSLTFSSTESLNAESALMKSQLRSTIHFSTHTFHRHSSDMG